MLKILRLHEKTLLNNFVILTNLFFIKLFRMPLSLCENVEALNNSQILSFTNTIRQ